MARNDLITRTVEAGRDVGQRSQERLEVLVGQLQRLSEDQLDQVAAMVGELRDRSVLSGEQLMASVDRRVREQLAAVGLARRADLKALEARVEKLEAGQAAAKPARKAAAATTGKKPAGAARKAPAKAATKPATKAAAKSPAKASAKSPARAARTTADPPPAKR